MLAVNVSLFAKVDVVSTFYPEKASLSEREMQKPTVDTVAQSHPAAGVDSRAVMAQ